MTSAGATNRNDPHVSSRSAMRASRQYRPGAPAKPAAKGAHVPLVKSFWLSNPKVKKDKAWIEPFVDQTAMTYRFEVKTGQPSDEAIVKAGTKTARGAHFRCILTGVTIPGDHIKSEGRAGKLGSRLIAIVAEGARGRIYVSPNAENERIAAEVKPNWQPEQELANDPRNLWCISYGLTHFKHLFTPRQLLAATTFSELVGEARSQVVKASGGDEGYANGIATYLAFSLSKVVDLGTTLVTWRTDRESSYHTFGKQALPMSWDYCELNPLLDGTGTIVGAATWTAKSVAESFSGGTVVGTVTQNDATVSLACPKHPLISTDPPYYDNIAYADLSDFFYIWLRHSLGTVYPELFPTLLTPKASELIASPYRHGGEKEKAKAFFEDGLFKTFASAKEVANPEFPLTVFYAFKQSEAEESDDGTSDLSSTLASTGWETMLGGLLNAGWQVDGTWPMRTELENRQVSLGTNALASSIVLVCRPRGADAGVASRRDFLAAMKRELPEALRNLQKGNIAPVDLAQAAIGPGMAVFSRYAKVLEADGSLMSVRTALALINQSLDEVLAEQEGEFDADTRWALAWFDQNGFNEGAYGVAETLCTAKNTSVSGMVEAGILAAKGGKVRLLKKEELQADWSPATDDRLTVWEATHHLIRSLDKGEPVAAALLKQLGAMAEVARDLSYRLYTVCERRKWSQDAIGYNALVLSWPDLKRLADEQRDLGPTPVGGFSPYERRSHRLRPTPRLPAQIRIRQVCRPLSR